MATKQEECKQEWAIHVIDETVCVEIKSRSGGRSLIRAGLMSWIVRHGSHPLSLRTSSLVSKCCCAAPFLATTGHKPTNGAIAWTNASNPASRATLARGSLLLLCRAELDCHRCPFVPPLAHLVIYPPAHTTTARLPGSYTCLASFHSAPARALITTNTTPKVNTC